MPVGLPGAAVVVLRHGRTVWSGQGRFAGHADVPLDATGRAQARAAAARLVPLRPSALVSSDLARARHTAEAVAAATGLAVTVDARLRGEHLGGWEGLTRAEAEARYPDEFARWRGGHVGRSAQREGLAAVAARATAALRDALARAVGSDRARGRGPGHAAGTARAGRRHPREHRGRPRWTPARGGRRQRGGPGGLRPRPRGVRRPGL